MTTASINSDEAHGLGAVWWVLSLIGLLSVAAGVVVLFRPGDSLPTLAVVAGIFILFDGIAEVGASLMRSTANRGFVALMGILSAVVGILLIRHPIRGVAAIALLIGIWLVAIGIARLVLAFEGEHRAWRAVVAVVEILAGIVIVASPDIGLVTLAVLTGIAFIANGMAMVGLGWHIHQLRSHPAPPHGVGAAPA